VQAAQQCVINALNIFRKDISPAGAAIFQSAAIACMENLRKDVTDSICAAINAGSSSFQTEYQLDTDIQVTGKPIVVSVFLKDPAGTLLTNRLPSSCAGETAKNISANLSLGEITSFNYDGYSKFTAEITSDVPGDGEMTVIFNNKVLSTYTPAANGNTSSISENIKQYTFVSNKANTPVRRDETDVE